MNKAIKKQAVNPTSNHAKDQPKPGHRQSEALLVQQSYQGPLPDPHTFAQYNNTCPGAAERILVMAEQSAQHAREMDKSILQAQIDVEKQNHVEARLGQMFGMVSTLALSAVAVYALHRGYPVVASIICSTTVTGLVIVFITGRKRKDSQQGNG